MIAGYFHEGSGLGNQLHRYVMTRVLALDNGVDFGMIGWENFKGHSFMNLERGQPVDTSGDCYFFNEKSEKNEEGNEVRGYDDSISSWAVTKKGEPTIIDGEFQGEKYFEHRLDEIREWLAVTPMRVPDDACILAFRGGEYVGVKDLFLPRSYWIEAMVEMRKINLDMRFRIVTDDVETAKVFFEGLDMYVGHEIGEDWTAIRYAKYLILSNSSFGILPALLNQNAEKIIAPKFWAGYNKGYWQLEQNEYKKFTYLEP